MANLLPSVIGNVVNQRAKLSSIRQRIGLESGAPKSQGTQMRQLAPSPPGGPANKPGAAQQAVSQATAADASPSGDNFDPESVKLPPEMEAQLRQKATEFLDQVGPDQQAQIDRERASQAPAAPQEGTAVVVDDERTKAALGPMADFFKKNGRLPTPEELGSLGARRELISDLGREPSETEVRLYMSKPPRTG